MDPAAMLRPSFLRRLGAVLGSAMVLVLGLLAVRPDWHELLCHHHHEASADAPQSAADDEESADHGCVVTLFARGQVLALLVFFVVPAACVARAGAGWSRPSAVFPSAVFRLPPICGPPVT